MDKHWLIAETITDDYRRQFPELDGTVLQLLWNRGMRTQEEIDVFLEPDWSRDTLDPFLFTQMRRAVERVFTALELGEVITVHGDYDADGTCGTAVLVTTVRDICRALSFSYNVTTYIPHRENEGYGMSVATMEHLAEHDKTNLVITVDCGISNKPAIDRGVELGIDTIVCDHHTMPDELPDAAILIHPLVPGETFSNKDLCGTGVAFKLASALLVEARERGADLPDGYEKWLLDLVAIATVTDVMPLRGENRVLETYGLLVLNKTRRPGLRKLLEVAGSNPGALDTVSIGFQIGPRLNAAGRMAHANEALALLIEEDETRAAELALRLHELNIERQKASQLMYEQAKRQIGQTDEPLIVACQEGWGAGLVGLVAGKLVNEYHRPVMVVGQDGETFVGSGRSIEGFDVTHALRHAGAHLDRFGGHPQACGFSVTGRDRFSRAVEAMKAFAVSSLGSADITPRLTVDVEIALHDIDWKLFDALQRFRPFGQGNPMPVFVSRGVRISSLSTVGKDGAHLKLRLASQRGALFDAIGFRMGGWAQRFTVGAHIDVAYEIQVNEWNGNRQLQLRLVDIDPPARERGD